MSFIYIDNRVWGKPGVGWGLGGQEQRREKGDIYNTVNNK